MTQPSPPTCSGFHVTSFVPDPPQVAVEELRGGELNELGGKLMSALMVM